MAAHTCFFFFYMKKNRFREGKCFPALPTARVRTRFELFKKFIVRCITNATSFYPEEVEYRRPSDKLAPTLLSYKPFQRFFLHSSA